MGSLKDMQRQRFCFSPSGAVVFVDIVTGLGREERNAVGNDSRQTQK